MSDREPRSGRMRLIEVMGMALALFLTDPRGKCRIFGRSVKRFGWGVLRISDDCPVPALIMYMCTYVYAFRQSSQTEVYTCVLILTVRSLLDIGKGRIWLVNNYRTDRPWVCETSPRIEGVILRITSQYVVTMVWCDHVEPAEDGKESSHIIGTIIGSTEEPMPRSINFERRYA